MKDAPKDLSKYGIMEIFRDGKIQQLMLKELPHMDKRTEKKFSKARKHYRR